MLRSGQCECLRCGGVSWSILARHVGKRDKSQEPGPFNEQVSSSMVKACTYDIKLSFLEPFQVNEAISQVNFQGQMFPQDVLRGSLVEIRGVAARHEEVLLARGDQGGRRFVPSSLRSWSIRNPSTLGKLWFRYRSVRYWVIGKFRSRHMKFCLGLKNWSWEIEIPVSCVKCGHRTL